MQGHGSEGLFENIKKSIVDFFANKDITAADVIRLVSCFGIGFICGLLLKRYFKYIIGLTVFTILLIALLDYVHFISLNHDKVKIALGFRPVESYNVIINKLLTQAQNHLIEIGSIILGCLLGFKVG